MRLFSVFGLVLADLGDWTFSVAVRYRREGHLRGSGRQDQDAPATGSTALLGSESSLLEMESPAPLNVIFYTSGKTELGGAEPAMMQLAQEKWPGGGRKYNVVYIVPFGIEVVRNGVDRVWVEDANEAKLYFSSFPRPKFLGLLERPPPGTRDGLQQVPSNQLPLADPSIRKREGDVTLRTAGLPATKLQALHSAGVKLVASRAVSKDPSSGALYGPSSASFGKSLIHAAKSDRCENVVHVEVREAEQTKAAPDGGPPCTSYTYNGIPLDMGVDEEHFLQNYVLQGNGVYFAVIDKLHADWGNPHEVGLFATAPAMLWSGNMDANRLNHGLWENLASGVKKYDPRKMPVFAGHFLPTLTAENGWDMDNAERWHVESAPKAISAHTISAAGALAVGEARHGMRPNRFRKTATSWTAKKVLQYLRVVMKAGHDNSLGLPLLESMHGDAKAAVELPPWGLVMAHGASKRSEGKPPHEKVVEIMQLYSDGNYSAILYFAMGTQGFEWDVRGLSYLFRQFAQLPDVLVVFAKPDLKMTSDRKEISWDLLGEYGVELPANVSLQGFLPQNDIFRHFGWIDAASSHSKPKIVYMAHGGAGGLAEAISFGVPVLCLPMLFPDQSPNCAKIAHYGLGRDLNRLSAALLEARMIGLPGDSKLPPQYDTMWSWADIDQLPSKMRSTAEPLVPSYAGQSDAEKSEVAEFYRRQNSTVDAPGARSVLVAEVKGMLDPVTFGQYAKNMQVNLAEAKEKTLDRDADVSLALKDLMLKRDKYFGWTLGFKQEDSDKTVSAELLHTNN